MIALEWLPYAEKKVEMTQARRNKRRRRGRRVASDIGGRI